MSVRMLTKDLLSLLGDLVLTAPVEAGLAGCSGILVHTARVMENAEIGEQNCLIGTSTNGWAVGHTWTEAGGYLPPTLLPVNYVRALTVSLKKLLTKDNAGDHVTEIRREGDEVVFMEDPDLFGDGFKQRFGYGNLDDWPRGLFPLLASVHLTAPPDLKPVENRTDFTASLLAPFLKIADKRSGTLSLYRVHHSLAVHVQIGVTYRGLIMPSKGWNESSLADGQAPEIGVYAADLPPLPEPEDAEESEQEPAGVSS